MNYQALIVLVLLLAIIIPVVRAEVGRRGTRRRIPTARPPTKPEAAARTPLRLVVNKNDMDRELAALLAKDSRKSTEREE